MFLYLLLSTQAKDLNVPVISEDDFLNMIATRPAGQAVSSPAPKTPKSSQKKTTPESSIKMETDDPSPPSVQQQKLKKSPETVKAKSIIQPKSAAAGAASTSTASSNGAGSTEAPADASLPWVDKYKPTAMKNIIGTFLFAPPFPFPFNYIFNWMDSNGSVHLSPLLQACRQTGALPRSCTTGFRTGSRITAATRNS